MRMRIIRMLMIMIPMNSASRKFQNYKKNLNNQNKKIMVIVKLF